MTFQIAEHRHYAEFRPVRSPITGRCPPSTPARYGLKRNLIINLGYPERCAHDRPGTCRQGRE